MFWENRNVYVHEIRLVIKTRHLWYCRVGLNLNISRQGVKVCQEAESPRHSWSSRDAIGAVMTSCCNLSKLCTSSQGYGVHADHHSPRRRWYLFGSSRGCPSLTYELVCGVGVFGSLTACALHRFTRISRCSANLPRSSSRPASTPSLNFV